MISFKKVSAILSSAVMVGASIGMAAAANFPNPFVVGGAADVAIVYGTGAGVSSLDLIQAGNIQTNLQSYMGTSTSGTTTTSGEVAELFSGGTKIYINDSLQSVKSVLTKSALPTVLKDGSFSGNVDATYTQKIDLSSKTCDTKTCDKITFNRQPKSSDDPTLALTTSTTQADYLYNATVTFNKAINFSHADSEGESIDLFGTTWTVGSATDTDTIVLLKSAQKLSLSSDNPTADVTVGGKDYTVELVSASDTAATVAVTDSSGSTESKEVNEAQSKKINGITIAVVTADETNLKLSASIIAGSDKVTLEDGTSVTTGEEATIVDGTLVDFGTGNPNNLTTLTISVYAPESDKDAIKPGESFVDPVYGTFKIDFAGFNIGSIVGADDSSRENIEFSPSGDDKMLIKFTDHRGYEKTIQWVKNQTTGTMLQATDDGKNITVLEGEKFHRGEYVVVGNEDEGYLLELTAVRNQSGGVTGDKVELKDIFSGSTYSATLNDDGSGTVDIGGKVYSVTLWGDAGISDTSYNVSLGYPDGTGANVAVIYPTIQTSKGAKIQFYEPKTITLDKWTDDITPGNLSSLKFPNGADGYATVTSIGVRIGASGDGLCDAFNFTDQDGNVKFINTSSGANESFVVTAGQVKYNISGEGTDGGKKINIRLLTVAEDVQVSTAPAVVIFEEKDDNAQYQALIVEIDDGGNSNDGIGIDTIEDTWSNAASGWSTTRYSDSKYEDRIDLWGSIVTVYSGDSDQKTATISYPNEQIYALLYGAEESASITASGGTTAGTQLGDVLVKDTEVSSVSSKNLIIVGGSCINSAAAKVLGFSGATCGAAFTDGTGVGTGEFLIKGVSGAYTSGKIALVVAGYEAADTVNAGKYLTTQTVDTSKEYKGTSATSATLVTTTA